MLPHAYRTVLAIPRVRGTILLILVARLPMTTMVIAVTLHVVVDLGRGYALAGLVGAAMTIGGAVGGPVVGRMIDRYGLRWVIGICGTCSAAFWTSAPHVPYPALALLAAPAGMLAIPVNTLARLFLTALVPEDRHRAVFTLDSMLTEACFIAGPPLIIFLITQFSSTVAFAAIGGCMALTSAALWVTNLPIRTAEQARPDAETTRLRLRQWLHGRLILALLITVGAVFTLIGTDLSVVAALREHGETSWTSIVIAMIAITSVTGGLIHGALKRSLHQATLALLMSVLLIPVGLLDHPWWLLGIALIPTNLMVTPTIAASSEAVSNLALPHVRGMALGLQDTATRLGMALGSPAVGFVMDHSSAAWGFAAAGLGGVAVATTASLIRKSAKPPAPHQAPTLQADASA
jgi:predicted MFS family arabinose efflux permease